MNINPKINKNFQQKVEGLSFSRFEMKYIIDSKISKILQKKISNFMELDKFAKKFSKKEYFVRSLYFDNDNFENFNEKVDGLKVRYKFRLRTYSRNNNFNPIIYLEKKGRYNQRTYKIRKKLNYKDFNYLLDDSKIFNLSKKFNNEKLIGEFIFDKYKKLIKPKVVIDYHRKPFINKIGNYFRLTFDSNLKSTPTNKLFYKNDHTKKVIAGYEILEVKFDRTIPPWFQKLIQSFELNRISVSKYVLGCESSGLAFDYEGR